MRHNMSIYIDVNIEIDTNIFNYVRVDRHIHAKKSIYGAANRARRRERMLFLWAN